MQRSTKGHPCSTIILRPPFILWMSKIATDAKGEMNADNDHAETVEM